MYQQENQDQKVKLDKLVANDADEWDIKNGVSLPPTRSIIRAPRVRGVGHVV